MEQKFKIGDLVKLKSGGPKMTINGIVKTGLKRLEFSGKFKAAWFNDKNEISEEVFHQDALEVYSEN